MAEEEALYSVNPWDMEEFFQVLQTFPPAQQERVIQFMAQHFTRRPKVMIPGQLKALRGKWQGTFQLECGGGRRLLYEVDEQRRAVNIIYLGDHPEWDKHRKMDRGR